MALTIVVDRNRPRWGMAPTGPPDFSSHRSQQFTRVRVTPDGSKYTLELYVDEHGTAELRRGPGPQQAGEFVSVWRGTVEPEPERDPGLFDVEPPRDSTGIDAHEAHGGPEE